MKFNIKFLPARFGDSIWIEYGDDGDKFYILIDGGTKGTRKDIKKHISSLPGNHRDIELLVITHIDRDHIEGILELLSEDDPGFTVGDLWFNGWGHLPDNPDDEIFGAVQGEKLTKRIKALNLPWNKEFDGKAVEVPADVPLPEYTTPGGMKFTLLSPYTENLAELKPKWEDEVRAANLDPGFGLDENDEAADDDVEIFSADDLPDVDLLAESAFHEDESPANGSSIAFIAEYDNRRVLFTGDAHPTVLLKSLEQYSPGQKVDLDLFKLPHHGSEHNINKDLLEKINCPKYVFSTNGSIFKHPKKIAVSRIIKWGGANPEIIFNYKSEENVIWELDYLCNRYNYIATYPASNKNGIEIDV